MKKYFDGITTFDELRKDYKRLALLNHPDRGGSTEAMQQINNEYDNLFIILKDRHNAEAPENKQMHEAPAAYREVLLRIINLIWRISICFMKELYLFRKIRLVKCLSRFF